MSGTWTTTIATYLFLDLDWSEVRQDISGNRTLVRLTLKLRHTGTGIWFSAPKSGVLHGQSFTYTGGFSGTGTKTLRTRDVWVSHNSNGSKSQSFSASFNPAITYQGSYRGNQSVSGTASLTAIPRASSITSFSIGSNLQVGTSNTVSLSLSRANSGFRHDIQLRDGSTVIASWNGESLPTSLTISSSQVNTLLSRMSSTTTRRLTLRVQTKSGSTNIGNAVTSTATATVNSNVRPTATGLSISVDGTRRDNSRGKYVQNYSRASVKFNENAVGGASIVSRSITIRHNGTKGNVTVINATSGVSNVLTQSGTYEVIATVTDSRGRTNTQTRSTFTVTAYNQPSITEFEAVRDSSAPTKVLITRRGAFSPMGSGDNTVTIQVQRRLGSGSWSNVVSNTTTTSSTFGTTIESTSNNVTRSYEFRMILTDQFGGRAEAMTMVPSQRVVLDIHKNEGVGIGKIHEQGVLDVNGDIFADGTLQIVPRPDGGNKSNPIQIYSTDRNGHGYIEYWGSDGVRKGHVGFGTTNNNVFTVANENNSHVNIIGNDLRINDTIVAQRGNNSNGQWVRFYDGTQICWNGNFSQMNNLTNTEGPLYRSPSVTWDFPMPFSSHVVVSVDSENWAFWSGAFNTTTSRVSVIEWASTRGHSGNPKKIMAVGRWK